MPKNKGKGGKNRRRGKNEGEEKRELITKEEEQGVARKLFRQTASAVACSSPLRVARLLGRRARNAHAFASNPMPDAVQSMRRSQRCSGRADWRLTAWMARTGSATFAAR